MITEKSCYGTPATSHAEDCDRCHTYLRQACGLTAQLRQQTAQAEWLAVQLDTIAHVCPYGLHSVPKMSARCGDYDACTNGSKCWLAVAKKLAARAKQSKAKAQNKKASGPRP